MPADQPRWPDAPPDKVAIPLLLELAEIGLVRKQISQRRRPEWVARRDALDDRVRDLVRQGTNMHIRYRVMATALGVSRQQLDAIRKRKTQKR